MEFLLMLPEDYHLDAKVGVDESISGMRLLKGMPRVAEKLKVAIEWLEHFAFLKVSIASLGGGALLAYLAKHIQALRHAPQADTLGYLIFGGLVALVIAISFLAARRSARHPPTRETPEDLLNVEEIWEAQPLRPIDLRGEIFDLYFRDSHDPYRSGYEVFVNARITNHGPQQATIAEFTLHVVIGDERSEGEQIPIPPQLRLRKRLLSIAGDTFQETPLVPRIESDHIYQNAVHYSGWLAFYVHSWGDVAYPYNAAFCIKMIDSLGEAHWIERSPQPYHKNGEVVLVEPEPLLPIKGIIMPPRSGL